MWDGAHEFALLTSLQELLLLVHRPYLEQLDPEYRSRTGWRRRVYAGVGVGDRSKEKRKGWRNCDHKNLFRWLVLSLKK